MNRTKLELLAPAGSFEALRAAVANGADAVYLGGERFNARYGASNFTDEELKAALDYAKERDVKIYVTLNTLIKDDEMNEVLQFAGFVYEEGADALIVQDIGLAGLLHRTFPDLKLHASTQMTIMNSNGVMMCEDMGIKRVVPARELSIKELEVIAKSCRSEIEIFIHGALCVSYSGQCLLSSYIGGRSGNRGQCAQPCRLPWRISADGRDWSGESYLMSTRDLMGLAELPLIKRIGISSLKIEGRMKSPEYVAIVTGIYRKYLDRLDSFGDDGYRIDGEDLQKLTQIFNRGGFNASYLNGSKNYRELIYSKHPKNRGIKLGTVVESNPDAVKVLLEEPIGMGNGIEVWDTGKGVPGIIISSILINGKHERYAPAQSMPWLGDMKTPVEKGSEVWQTYSKPLMLEARSSYENGEKRLIPLEAVFKIRVGEPAILTLSDPDGNTVSTRSEEAAQKAQTRALSKERIIEQLNKTGDTPYSLNSSRVETDDLSTLPVSALNAMRREALEAIKQKRISRGKRENKGMISYSRESEAECREVNKLSLSAFFYQVPLLPADFHETVGRIYIPVMSKNEVENLRNIYGREIYVWTPNIVKDEEMPALIDDLRSQEGVIDGVSADNSGTLNMLCNNFPGFKLHVDAPMNVFNSASLDTMAQWGVSSVTVSPELKFEEAARLQAGSIQLETYVYGRIPLMTLEYCPAGSISECRSRCEACPKSSGFLKDRKEKIFPYVRNHRFRRTQLFTPDPIFADRDGQTEAGYINLFRMAFFDEDISTVKIITDWFYRKINDKNYIPSEEVRKKIETVRKKSSGGHWLKGV